MTYRTILTDDQRTIHLGGEEYLLSYSTDALEKFSFFLEKNKTFSLKEAAKACQNCGASITIARQKELIIQEQRERGLIDNLTYIAEYADIVINLDHIPVHMMVPLIYFGLVDNKEAMKEGIRQADIRDFMDESAFKEDYYVKNCYAVINTFMEALPLTSPMFRMMHGEALKGIEDDFQRRAKGYVDMQERVNEAAERKRNGGKKAKKVTKKKVSRKKAT